jgi:formiminoglutamate deiminase
MPSGVSDGVLIEIRDGYITQVETDAPCPADAERLSGLTLAGIANAHSHAFHRALRGRTHRGAGDFWTWREQMYAVAGRLTPDNYLPLARAVFAEMLLAGYTCVGEFHYVHHTPSGDLYPDPNAMGRAIINAAEQSGIRLTLLDACYLQGGIGQAVSEQQRRFSDGSAQHWKQRVSALADSISNGDASGNVRIGAAIHSVRAVDALALALVADYAAEASMPLHAHVSEQIAENVQVYDHYGCSPTALLAQHGVLSQDFTAVHATHLTDGDIALYGVARCTCCFCPTTERDLADGIGPSRELRAAGVALAIGSDQHAVIDPFEEMRGIELDERLSAMRRGTHAPHELLEAASVNGYRSLGWPEGGTIASGSLADLVTVSLNSVRLAGAPADALVDALVFCATATDVDHVMVGGRTVVAGGKHVVLDVSAELASAILAVHEDPS